MSRDRENVEEPADGRTWSPEKWRPSSSFDSSGFSPESGYSRLYGASTDRPRGGPQRRSPVLLIVAIALVLMVGAAGLLWLMRYLKR